MIIPVDLAVRLRQHLSNSEWHRCQTTAIGWALAHDVAYGDVDEAVTLWLVDLARRAADTP